MCAATAPAGLEFLDYDWKRAGVWNLTFVVGVALGGWLTVTYLNGPTGLIGISAATVADLRALGITDFTGLVPRDLISFSALGTLPGIVAVVVGGFLVGFGARYAGGCTSGHAISGLAALEAASLIAVVGFFIGGLFVTHVLLPLIL